MIPAGVPSESAKSLRDLSFQKSKRIYFHSDVGFNYRLTNIQAAIGLAQLERIDELTEMRSKNAYLYNEYLKDVEGIKPHQKRNGQRMYIGCILF